MAETVSSKFDFSGIDLDTVDPDRMPLGTGIQDCALISQTYERGAHATPTEAAVFATVSRVLQNNKNFALAASSSFETYLGMPQEDAKTALEQAQQFGSPAASSAGTGAQTEEFLQSFNIGSQKQSIQGDAFGESLLDSARDCIPCGMRLMAFLELHPNIDLLGAMEANLKTQLETIMNVGNLLNNFDAFGDFCNLLDMLSFMCVPDLQRIIVTLMALFMLDLPKLNGLMGMIQGLIAPLFSSILMAITSLLDKFVSLVTGPLECVIDAMSQQIQKLNVTRINVPTPAGNTAAISVKTPLSQVSGGLENLSKEIRYGKQQIEKKLHFYISQMKAMMGEMGGGDGAYLQASLQKLTRIRMISFIKAVITAKGKGHAACSSEKPPEVAELDNFFQNFLSPQTSFNIWIDDEGQIHLDEKVLDFEPLSESGNMFQFEGGSLVDASVSQSIEDIAAVLSKSTYVVAPCKLETTSEDVDKVNQWIAELSEA